MKVRLNGSHSWLVLRRVALLDDSFPMLPLPLKKPETFPLEHEATRRSPEYGLSTSCRKNKQSGCRTSTPL